MRYLTIHQVAERMNKHPETVREMCRKGAKYGGLNASKGPARTSRWEIPETEIPAWYARNSNTGQVAA